MAEQLAIRQTKEFSSHTAGFEASRHHCCGASIPTETARVLQVLPKDMKSDPTCRHGCALEGMRTKWSLVLMM